MAGQVREAVFVVSALGLADPVASGWRLIPETCNGPPAKVNRLRLLAH